jgi:hypothetical protein
VCGIAGSPAPVENLLPLAAEPRDWVGIALDAVTCLQQPFEHVVVDIGEVRQPVAPGRVKPPQDRNTNGPGSLEREVT